MRVATLSQHHIHHRLQFEVPEFGGVHASAVAVVVGVDGAGAAALLEDPPSPSIVSREKVIVETSNLKR